MMLEFSFFTKGVLASITHQKTKQTYQKKKKKTKRKSKKIQINMLFRVTPNRFFHEDIKLMSSELCRTQRHHTTDVKIKKLT